MKPPDDDLRKNVADWLRIADEDMRVAEYLLDQSQDFSGAITFHCQQAAEKYLKAWLTWNDVDFPKTHALATLLRLIEKSNKQLADELHGVLVLTQFAAEFRYPGEHFWVTPADAREAVELARKVRQAVLPLLPTKLGAQEP